jgi:hypothetical protein
MKGKKPMINFELKYEGIHTHIVATRKKANSVGVYSDFNKAKAALTAFYRTHQRNWQLAAATARKLATVEIVTDTTINGTGANNVRSIASAKSKVKTKTASRRWSNSRRVA